MLTDEQREVIRHQLTECGLEELLPQVELLVRGVSTATDTKAAAIVNMLMVAHHIGCLKGRQQILKAQNEILKRFPHVFSDLEAAKKI